jgi:hypothetical protein
MTAPTETIKLQLAMAFGQGTGTLLASQDALNQLLSTQGDLVSRAATNWNVTHWAFVELVRILGQLSAAHAAAANSPIVRWEDISACIEPVIDLCPCTEAGARRAMF